AFHLWINFDDPGKKRAFRQLVEQRAKLQPPHRITRNADIAFLEDVPKQLPIVHQETVNLAERPKSTVLLAFQRRQNRAKQIRSDEFAPAFSLATKPGEHLAGGRVFPNAS